MVPVTDMGRSRPSWRTRYAEVAVTRLIATLFVVAAAGCGRGADDQFYECRDAAVLRGEIVHDIEDTGVWRVGGLPLWTTPDWVLSTLGEPEWVHVGAPWDSEVGSVEDVATLRYDSLRTTYVFVGDTLAFLAWAPIGSTGLIGAEHSFEDGAKIGDIRSTYPQSYRCRSWPRRRAPVDSLSPTYMTLVDTLRGALVELQFEQSGLASAGVYRHEGTGRALDQLRSRPDSTSALSGDT